MKSVVRWGVIGSAGIARRRTIPEGIIASSNAELDYVFDVNENANQTVADEFGAKAVGSLEELLATDVDAVYIATPAYLHCDQVCVAALAGKHVLCEKPLGLTVQEAEKMIVACKDANVHLGTALMMRLQSQHRAALELIEAGKLGRLTYGRAQLSCWYPPIEGAWRQNSAAGGWRIIDGSWRPLY